MKKGFTTIFFTGLTFVLGNNIGMTLFTMYAALYFNASSSTIGLLTSVSSLISMLIVLPLGALSDRFGRKPLVISGLIFSVVSTSILFLASSVHMLFIAQIVMGFTFPVFAPNMQSLAADLDPDRSGRVVGLYLLSPSIGMFIGPLVASLLLRFTSIRNTYLCSLIVIISSLILASRIKPTKSVISSRFLSNFWNIIRRKRIWVTSLTSTFFFFLFSSLMTFYPVYALGVYRTDPSAIAVVFSLRSLVLMLARIFAVTKLTSKISEKRLMVLALIVSTSVALLPIMQNFWQSAFLIMLNGVGHGIVFPMGAMMIAESTSSDERGTANAIYILFNNINNTLSPFLMGFVADSWGLAIIFPLITIAPIMGVISSKYIP